MNGVDVSSFQGAPATWSKEAGAIQWAAVKITELIPPTTAGGSAIEYLNPDAAADWAYLKGQGLVRVAYLFGHPSVDPTASVNWFLSQLTPLGIEDGDAVALDHEVADSVGPAAVTAWAHAVLKQLQDRLSRVPLLYTFLDFAGAGNCATLGAFPLWISDPSSPAGHPRVPAPWSTWALHQYATSGNIDRDVSSYATPAAMTAALGKTVPKPVIRKDLEMILVSVDQATVPAGTAWPGVFLMSSTGSLLHVTPTESGVNNVASYQAAGVPGPVNISFNEYLARGGTSTPKAG